MPRERQDTLSKSLVRRRPTTNYENYSAAKLQLLRVNSCLLHTQPNTPCIRNKQSIVEFHGNNFKQDTVQYKKLVFYCAVIYNFVCCQLIVALFARPSLLARGSTLRNVNPHSACGLASPSLSSNSHNPIILEKCHV